MHHEASSVVLQTVDLPAKGVALGGVKDVHGPAARKVNTDRAAGANKDLTTRGRPAAGKSPILTLWHVHGKHGRRILTFASFLITVASTATRPNPARRATRTSLAPRRSCTRS